MNIKITIDARGAVVIPDVVRQSLGLKEADELILDTFGDTILLRAANSTAVELYSEERIREFAEDEAQVGRMLSATRNPPDR